MKLLRLRFSTNIHEFGTARIAVLPRVPTWKGPSISHLFEKLKVDAPPSCERINMS